MSTQYLSKPLGPAYVAQGFATGQGTASGFNQDWMVHALALTPPLPKPVEA
ncbi:erythromycin esterase family protein [Hymenobacter fodinae]|uniref:erythromycin esterase family protein n=1 Tax=Hymenobacter fodinae TaxID=2510796 RepID=UPI0014367250|nr:erythromycin esterase family protein [Hymenobacter fodinae]